MCGICGIVAIDGGRTLDPAFHQAMPAMTEAIRHRGPDGGASLALPGATLGHRRLAIIDRAGGAQPMANEDESIWIVFNGEIYNHHDVRRDLEARGHAFRTRSDTEAILHAYEEWGPGCVTRFEGMFAFGIYDSRRHELFLARDRVGKKPMFWGVLDGALHFASEIKALRESPAFDDTLDLSALESYLSLGYFIAPQTVYRSVQKLEPGHWLLLSQGRVTIRKYWDIERFDDDRRPASPILGELEALLRQNVFARLESEVPLGAFLSGGIDSALIVAFMAEAARHKVITTSVGFCEAAHNELDGAATTARHLGAQHHPEVVTPNLADVLDRIVASFDEPFADASAVPTYYVSAMARRHVTVALSGDGGDEAFGGYTFRYIPHALESALAPLTTGRSGTAVAAALGRIWPRSPRLPRLLRLARTFENLSVDRASAYYRDLCLAKPDIVHPLLGLVRRQNPMASPVFETITDVYRRCPSRHAIQRAEYADLKVYLPNDVLVKVDRMSMAHGLEVRCPLLDRRVLEFAFRVPATTKMPQLRPKRLLRRLARARIPPEVLRRPKHGFTAPIAAWLAGPYAELFRSEVLESASKTSKWLDRREVARLFAEHRARRADHSYVLWAVWMLERWARQRCVPAGTRSALRPPEGPAEGGDRPRGSAGRVHSGVLYVG
jgi:asparagine synthase (glutamine-hydrolysing)